MKILRLNMTKLTADYCDVPREWEFLGGRGLTSSIIAKEIPPQCDPVGENNKVIFAPGILVGTGAPTAARLSVGGKSPLTMGSKEANAGGMAAINIAKLDIKAIVAEGINDKLYTVFINKDGVKFELADELKEKGTYETCDILTNKYGKLPIICIGPAGERKYPIAGVAATDKEGHPSRYAARGGLGAVMGSKGIKAIVIDSGGCKLKPKANPAAFAEVNKAWHNQLSSAKKLISLYGTMGMVEIQNKAEVMPSYGFRGKALSEEDVAKVTGQTFAKIQASRGGCCGHSCHFGCPVTCSNVYNDRDGKYITSGFEYETMALNGPNCGVLDLDFLAKVDRFCDDFGVDTIDWGGGVSMAIESGYIKYGDQDAMWALTEEIKNETLMGKILAQGTEIAGKVLGSKRITATKGQGFPAYDPRAYKGTAVTYATSPQGACHTAGNTLPGRTGYRDETKGLMDPSVKDNMVELSKDLQALVMLNDSLGLCSFSGCNLDALGKACKLLNAAFGTVYTLEELIKTGENALRNEIIFNHRAGVGITDIPEFFRNERTSDRDLIYDVPFDEIEKIWDSYIK